MPVYLWVIAAVMALLLDFLLASEFYKIAIIKGWASKKYFVYAFFFTLVGYLMVLALPDRGGYAEGSYESGDLPEL